MEWAAGNVFIRPSLMNKGDVIDGHGHNFDHVSIVLRGAVRVKPYELIDTGGRETYADEWGDEQERVIYRKEFKAAHEFYSPTSTAGMDRAHVLIKAGVQHEIEALEANTVFWCVYAHRTPQGDIVQEFTGWEKSYA